MSLWQYLNLNSITQAYVFIYSIYYYFSAFEGTLYVFFDPCVFLYWYCVFSTPLHCNEKETKQGQNIAQLADVTYASQVTAFFSVFSVLG